MLQTIPAVKIIQRIFSRTTIEMNFKSKPTRSPNANCKCNVSNNTLAGSLSQAAARTAWDHRGKIDRSSADRQAKRPSSIHKDGHRHRRYSLLTQFMPVSWRTYGFTAVQHFPHSIISPSLSLLATSFCSKFVLSLRHFLRQNVTGHHLFQGSPIEHRRHT